MYIWALMILYIHDEPGDTPDFSISEDNVSGQQGQKQYECVFLLFKKQIFLLFKCCKTMHSRKQITKNITLITAYSRHQTKSVVFPRSSIL
jgi:hypothetical protein